jgi:hypothetical protein
MVPRIDDWNPAPLGLAEGEKEGSCSRGVQMNQVWALIVEDGPEVRRGDGIPLAPRFLECRRWIDCVQANRNALVLVTEVALRLRCDAGVLAHAAEVGDKRRDIHLGAARWLWVVLKGDVEGFHSLAAPL